MAVKEYISDRITKEMVAEWNQGDYIFIDAQTGRGKTTFVMNNVHAVAKKRNTKILYLYNRIALGKQTRDKVDELNKYEHIDTMSYQRLADLCFDWVGIPHEDKYGFIVMDEFHYFLADANFNRTTNVSIKRIIENTTLIKIMLSATGKKMIEYLKREHQLQIETHTLERDYSYISELWYFENLKELTELVKMLITINKKFLLFVGNAQEGLELHEAFSNDTYFNCSKTHKRYSSYISPEMTDIIENESFDGKLGLITTTALDNGVNINDDDLEFIILYKINDPDTAIQCIGRKRINSEDEKVKLFVKNWSKRSITKSIARNESTLEKLRLIHYSGEDEFFATYPHPENLKGIYPVKTSGDTRYEYNKLMYHKMELDYEFKTSMHEKLSADPDAYKKFFANELGIKEYKNLKDHFTLQDIDAYLYDTFVSRDKFMNKQDRKELAHKLNIRNQYGRPKIGMGSINDELERIESKYRLIDKRPYVTNEETNEQKQVTMYKVIEL